MMKPGIGSYERFKELFDRYSKAAGKKQYLIPYFIAAHPGTSDADMLELALWLKQNGFRADQVQAFLPGPMSYSAAMYHTGKNPLRPVKRDSEEVLSVKTPEQRRLHKAFLRYHDAKNWPLLDTALRKMGRADLIGHGPGKLIPNGHRDKPGQRPRPGKPRPGQAFVTQRTGMAQFEATAPGKPRGKRRRRQADVLKPFGKVELDPDYDYKAQRRRK
jgi:hypothetical protein